MFHIYSQDDVSEAINKDNVHVHCDITINGNDTKNNADYIKNWLYNKGVCITLDGIRHLHITGKCCDLKLQNCEHCECISGYSVILSMKKCHNCVIDVNKTTYIYGCENCSFYIINTRIHIKNKPIVVSCFMCYFFIQDALIIAIDEPYAHGLEYCFFQSLRSMAIGDLVKNSNNTKHEEIDDPRCLFYVP